MPPVDLPIRPPLIVHHMAALDGQFPPNSLEGIRACLDAGARFIEIDVMALEHDDYLLVHDPVLEAETTGVGNIGDTAPEAAAALYLKGRDGLPAAFHPARLSQVVALFGDYPPQARLQVDFKNVLPFADDEPLERIARLLKPLADQVIVSSGADWQLRRLHRIAPWLELGFDIQFYIDWRSPDDETDPRVPPYRQGAYGYWDDHPLAMARFYSTPDYLTERCAALATLVPGATTFYIDHRLLAQSLDDGFNWADALHEAGITLDAWTLDIGNPLAEANAGRLLAAGVDQFTTNTPLALGEALRSFDWAR